jgi:hypothetical protein
MTDAKVRCSACGAELTNLTFSWGKRQSLWGLLGFLPIVAILVWMQLWMFRPNREFATELNVSLIERRAAKNRLDVLERLKNVGSHTWDRITVEAEVYDKDGRFMDEASNYISAILSPGSEEHFRLTLENPSESMLDESSKVVLKVTDADEDRF